MYKENPKIAVFGLGHMGLPTAALFAQRGLQVLGVDINKKNVDLVNSGKSPIMEPGLGDLVQKTVASGNLSATDNGKDAAYDADVMMVIVPTPVDLEKRSDLEAVKTACKTISSSLNKGDLVIIESTVPPGTCENLVIPLLEESGLKVGEDFGLAFTPERALPNNTIYEISHNARVIGGINRESADNAAEIYGKITEGEII
ncbi:MAG TPA: nucleotide sugar dehydrogenase, partial [Methanobacterium sp.]